VSNPIRTSFFNESTRAERNEKPVILNIGNISPRKRQVETLEMLKSLHEQGFEFEIRFVGVCGDDGYARCFQKKIDEVAHLGFARYMGIMNEENLVVSIDKADALCHFPSEEAFGLVVAEALSRNLKFFGSSTGGVIDVTRGVEGAELFDPDDWSSMSDGISKWITLGYPLLASANRIMEGRYHPRVIAKRHIEIYREVLGRLRQNAQRCIWSHLPLRDFITGNSS
jgi:glycosyltransferase involved in cell wall biosynthesis